MSNEPQYHPRRFASERPDHPAVVMGGSGETLTYRELEDRANQVANLFRSRGLGPGANVAILMENNLAYLEVAWAAQRSGMYFTPINSHLRRDEAQYIAEDCGAELLVTSAAMADVALGLDVSGIANRLMVGAAKDPFESYEAARDAQPVTPIADETEGQAMLYSGGTTGRPKGVQKPLTDSPLGDPSAISVLTAMALEGQGIGADSVFLSPAPLYHAAPLVYSMALHRLGTAVVVMERFDPARCLELIERHRVTAGQFVPTMFVRLLQLPEDVRAKADVSSLRFVVHAAAPCPVSVKRQMMDWWGPIIHEYYSGTEDIGYSMISPEEWLAHPGSVGRPFGEVHIVGDDGEDVAVGETGTIYFAGGRPFEYHNDPGKTAAIANEKGWRTIGDVGHLDADGYLYLTDRAAHMIISGGVNIYPQETEDVLIEHPAVVDVAVIGVPSEDMGEEVKAVVEVANGVTPGPDFADELIAFCRERLTSYKCPRSVDVVDELPRDPNGKLYKRLLRERYWEGRQSLIASD
jgi:fatty-acyl-CoA synthase